MPLMVLADAPTATVSGFVLDSKGGAIHGAKVVARNRQNGVERATSTNEAGAYRLESLTPAEYDFEVSFPQFKTAKKADVLLEVCQRARLDFSLSPGDVSDTLNIESSPTLVQSQSSTLPQS